MTVTIMGTESIWWSTGSTGNVCFAIGETR